MVKSAIDLYIDEQKDEIKERLIVIRNLGLKLLPNATEVISWGMPTFKGNKYIFHYAVNKNHIGIYPGPQVIDNLKDELVDYKTSKGAIQFPNNKELPIKLLEKIIKEASNNDKRWRICY